MSPQRAHEDALEEDFLPEPGDHEHVTRGEHRRAIHLFVSRLARIEGFMYERVYESDGVTVRRRSLNEVIEAVDAFLLVMCTIARTIRTIAQGVAIMGGATLTALGVAAAMGWSPF